jgi:hypothetical protein
MKIQTKGRHEISPSASSSFSSADGVPQGRAVVVIGSGVSRDACTSTDPDDNVQTESTSSTTTPQNNGAYTVIQPGEFDILCGRGRSFQDHSGNRVLRQVVELHMERFKTAKRSHKAPIASEIVAAFKANGNHFLKQDDASECWEEINKEDAKEKVSHCFRSRSKILLSSRTSFCSPGNFQHQLDTSGRAGQLLAATANTHLVRNGYQTLLAMMHTAASPPSTAQNVDTTRTENGRSVVFGFSAA